MMNDHLSHEEAQKLIEQRMKEAESYSLQKQLGFGDTKSARWIFLFIILIVAVVLTLF
jgi:hypothetical protein